MHYGMWDSRASHSNMTLGPAHKHARWEAIVVRARAIHRYHASQHTTEGCPHGSSTSRPFCATHSLFFSSNRVSFRGGWTSRTARRPCSPGRRTADPRPRSGACIVLIGPFSFEAKLANLNNCFEPRMHLAQWPRLLWPERIPYAHCAQSS